MSLWRDELKPAVGTLASLVVLATVAVASLGRVIEAPGYVPWAVAALLIGGAFALAFGHRSLALGFGLLLLFGVFSLPPLFLRGKSSALLPTPGAFSSLRKLFTAGFDAIPKSTPPVGAAPKFLVMLWVSLLLLGFLCAAWVVVRRPVGAVVSILSVVTFTGSVGEGDGRNAIAIAAVAATGAFFLAEGRQRIARWGGGRISIPGWLGLPTLAIACLVALGAPIVLGETPIVQLQSAIRPRVVIIKPLSDIKQQLKVDPPLEVMRVTSVRPTYWRLTGLDTYDGKEWVREAHPRDVVGRDIRDPEPPTTGGSFKQTYRLTSLLAPWLPAAYAATTIESEAAVQLDEESQTLLLRDDADPGLSYTVISRIPRVTTNQTIELKPSDDPLASAFRSQAKQIAGGARTPLDIARRMEKHFRGYTYSEDVAGGHSVQRLQQFLADRAGYCEQFAAAMTLMLRSVGVEARVGVGFLPGGRIADEYVVSTRDAHAWVEADIPGAGWVAFDPTPGRAEAASVPPETQNAPAAVAPEPQPTTVPQPTPQQDQLPDDASDNAAGRQIPVDVLYGLLAAAAAGSIPAAKSVRRRRRRRGSTDDVVVGAYDELVDRARDLGHRQASSETLREFVSRILRSDENAHRLAWLGSRALYGPGTSSQDDATQAWGLLRKAEGSLRGQARWYRRVLALIDPRTLLPDRAVRRVRTRVASAFGRA